MTTPLLKPNDVAAMLGMSKSWVYAAAEDGRIPCVRLPGIPGKAGPLRFVQADLDAWLESARRAWRPGDTTTQTLDRARGTAA